MTEDIDDCNWSTEEIAKLSGEKINLEDYSDLNKTLRKYKRRVRAAVRQANRAENKEN